MSEFSPNKQMKGDLTEGPIIKKLLGFSLPLIASFLVMQLYNVTDSVIVGNFVNSDALAAVNASFPLMMFYNAVFMGISAGAGIVVSQTFGAKDLDRVNKSANTAFALAYIIGTVVTVLGVATSGPLLVFLGTPANILEDSKAYLSIIMAGTLGNSTYNLGSGILRGLGDSKWPFWFLVFCSALNVALDLLFVVAFNMGVPGVAWATIIAQFLSALLVLARIQRGDYPFKLSIKSLRIDRQLSKLIIKLSIPTALQNTSMSVGALVIQTFANRFGSELIAANSIIQKLDGFVMLPMFGFSMALSTFVGQNVGADKIDRVNYGVRKSIFMSLGYTIVLAVLLWFFGGTAMYAFTDNQNVLDMGLKGIRRLAVFYIFMGQNVTLSGSLRGAGAAMLPMLASLAGIFVRIPVAYVLAVAPHDYTGLFWAMGISMLVNYLIVVTYYRFGKWRNKGIMHTLKPRSDALE